ncbi:MAG: RluA family pseudouridine synthase [Victivallaceae bacterium]
MTTEPRQIFSAVESHSEGMRLDHWLAARFTYLSRNQWQNQVKAGTVRVNNSEVRSSRILHAGDVVLFKPENVVEPPVDFNYEITYEDEYFLVVNKGGNLPCHPAGAFFENTLWRHMSSKFGKVYLANRLDRETSGLLLAAKTPKIANLLSAMFISGQIQKKYLALVYGIFEQEINAVGYLEPDKQSIVRKKRNFVSGETTLIPEESESAETLFLPVKNNGQYSLVCAMPKTGRLHQIRATLFSLGYPLLGDKLYGPDDTIYLRLSEGAITAEDWQKLVMKRQALHAAELTLSHPVTKQIISFQAPLPDDFLQI